MENLRKFCLLDSEENILYETTATEEIINHANKDMRFATILLQLCKDEGRIVFDQPISEYYSDVKENLFTSNAGTSKSTSTTSTFEKQEKTNKSVGKTKNNNDTCKKSTDVKNWSHKEVLLLIAAYKEYQLEFSEINITNGEVWTKITDHVNNTLAEQNLPPIGKEKCITKWDTLKRQYKRLKDSSNQSGSAPITWTFYDEMEEVFGEQPWVKPLSTAGSSTTNKMDPDIISPPQKRQKTLTNFCEELLATKKENSEIRKQHHREKIASIAQLSDAVNKLVDCITKGHGAS